MVGRREFRDAVRNLSFKAVSLGLERLCRLLVVVASAPILGQAAFGRFVFASTVTSLLALGTDLGLGVWTTRALARSRDRGSAITSVGLVLRSFASVPYGFAVAGVALFGARGEARTAVAVLGVAALVNAFVDHVSAILRGYERFQDEARLSGLRAVLTAAFGLVAIEFGRSLASLCLALTAASVGSALYGLTALLRLHPLKGCADLAIDRALARVALHESLPIWLAGLLSLLYFKIDSVFLPYMAGDAELGAYGAAYKFFEGAMIVPSVLLAVTFPRLARAHTDPFARRRLERQLSMLLLALGLTTAAICFFGAVPLVRLAFGQGFGRAVVSLRVLSMGLPLLYLNFGLTHFLVARDMGRAMSFVTLLMLVVNVSLNLALIPRRLGPGAAWATVLTEVALTVSCVGVLRE